MSDRLVLGIDSSTQSTKVEVREAETGRLLSSGRASHRIDARPPRSEQDPEQWWAALRAAIAQSGVRRVDAISVAAQQHGLVALDHEDSVIRPAKLWNDLESAPQCHRLVEGLGRSQWALACGSVPVPSFTITKLAWLREHEPESFDRLAKVVLPHDWINLRLTGDCFTDRGDASGTGYWSPREARWRTDLLEMVAERDWLRLLPRVAAVGEAAGQLSARAAAALGLDGGALVAPGTGDNMAAALGLGLRTGEVAMSIGTSGTVYTVAGAPIEDASGNVAGFADAFDGFLPLICTLNAARVTDSFAAWLGVDHQTFDKLALEGGGGALLLIPYLDGERTPNRPDATGTLLGLTTATTRSDLARAAILGVLLGLMDAMDHLLDVAGGDGEKVNLIGGGAASPAYRALLADLLGRPVAVPEGAEWVARGACVQAAAILLECSPSDVHARWGRPSALTVAPQGLIDDVPGIRRRYREARG